MTLEQLGFTQTDKHRYRGTIFNADVMLEARQRQGRWVVRVVSSSTPIRPRELGTGRTEAEAVFDAARQIDRFRDMEAGAGFGMHGDFRM